MISVYNIHHSPAVWDDAEAFRPERFSVDTPTPNEQNTDYRYIHLGFTGLCSCCGAHGRACCVYVLHALQGNA